MKSKIKKVVVYSFAGIGVILLVLILVGLMAGKQDVTEVTGIIDSIDAATKERGYALEDIDTAITQATEEDLETQGSIKRAQGHLSTANEKAKIAKSKNERVRTEVEKLGQLDTSGKHTQFVEKMTESCDNYKSYTESVEKFVEQFNKILEYQSHYIKLIHYFEEIDKNEQLIDPYFETEKYSELKEVLKDTNEKVALARKELSSADGAIEFYFNTKMSKTIDYYAQYGESLAAAVDYIDNGELEKAEESIDEALEFGIKAGESIPTSSTVKGEIDMWFEDNLYATTTQARTYITEAVRAHNEAAESYKNT